MCLYPKLIRNKKYLPNKKNKGIVPKCNDDRTKLVPVGCGKCIECMKQKKMQWQVRLLEEIRHDNTGKFVTLTFSNEELIKLCKETGIKESNAIATIAVRRYLERWRKKYKKSVKHWLITELGHDNTERIHLHGIIFTNEVEDIVKIWKYGNVFIGSYVNEKTINYIVKYVNKIDTDHKNFNGQILCSAGIGKKYLDRIDSKINTFDMENTKEYYRTRSGHKINLPIYYRNKIYTDEEKEFLWLNKLDKNIRYICGEKIDVSNGEEEYFKTLEYYQSKNKRLGYGDDSEEWKKQDYNVTLNMLKKAKKLSEYKKNTSPLQRLRDKKF